jgi:hypothetical protein
MKPKIQAPQLPPEARTSEPGLDIVVPVTTRPLTRAALTAAERTSAGLLPLIRMVRIQVVPFPLQMEAAPVSADVLHRDLTPLAAEFGAHLQICFARDEEAGLLHYLAKNSVVVIAARRRCWRTRWWKSREERLACRLDKRGYNVMLEFTEKNNA